MTPTSCKGLSAALCLSKLRGQGECRALFTPRSTFSKSWLRTTDRLTTANFMHKHQAGLAQDLATVYLIEKLAARPDVNSITFASCARQCSAIGKLFVCSLGMSRSFPWEAAVKATPRAISYYILVKLVHSCSYSRPLNSLAERLPS